MIDTDPEASAVVDQAVEPVTVGSCLFVTRKFPPSTGGMETLSAQVWSALSSRVPKAQLVASGRGNQHLPWWLLVATTRTARALLRRGSRRVDVVVVGDALMYLLLRPLLALTRVPTVVVVHGLDLIWTVPGYRGLVRRALGRADLLVANSEATANVVADLGLPADRTVTVRPGVTAADVTGHDRAAARRQLTALVPAPDDAVYLLTLGRVVRRKGARWFITEVLPRLPKQVVYVVAGEGPDSDEVAEAARCAGVTDRVRLLGHVDDATRETLLRGVDLFVQPNVPVPGDMEGFGLVVIEAALRGTPVLASRLEGITDAVIDGETGLLCAPGDADEWVAALTELLEGDTGQAQDEPTSADPVALADLIALGARFQVEARSRYGSEQMATAWVRVLGRAGRSRR